MAAVTVYIHAEWSGQPLGPVSHHECLDASVDLWQHHCHCSERLDSLTWRCKVAVFKGDSSLPVQSSVCGHPMLHLGCLKQDLLACPCFCGRTSLGQQESRLGLLEDRVVSFLLRTHSPASLCQACFSKWCGCMCNRGWAAWRGTGSPAAPDVASNALLCSPLGRSTLHMACVLVAMAPRPCWRRPSKQPVRSRL